MESIDELVATGQFDEALITLDNWRREGTSTSNQLQLRSWLLHVLGDYRCSGEEGCPGSMDSNVEEAVESEVFEAGGAHSFLTADATEMWNYADLIKDLFSSEPPDIIMHSAFLRSAIAIGELDRGVRYLDRLELRLPSGAPSDLWCAHHRLALGQHNQALEALSRSGEHLMRSSIGMATRAEIALILGHSDESQELAAEARRLNSRTRLAWEVEGDCNYYRGSWRNALSCYSAAIDLWPGNRVVLLRAARLRWKDRHRDEAVALARTAVKLFPGDEDAYLLLNAMLILHGRLISVIRNVRVMRAERRAAAACVPELRRRVELVARALFDS